MTTETNLIGVYTVDGQADVHLIELDIKAKHTDIDIGGFTQRQDGINQMSWQSPWDEKYLNEKGSEITGDWFKAPQNVAETTRLAFFLHFIDFNKPLTTPFGDIDLSPPEPMPDRLSSIIEYEEPD